MTYLLPGSSRRLILLFSGVFFFIFILQPSSIAQNYFFDNYSVAEGMAQSTVFDIIQDHNDYIWLGTREGVSRFDGNEFINYTLEDGMAENGVRVIFRDSLNNIWFGHSGGGISIYDGQKFRIFSQPGATFNSDITAILTDKEQNIWFTSELSGVARVNQVGDSLGNSEYKLYKGDDISDRVFGAYKTANDSLYFITDAFLKTYLPGKDAFESYYIEGMPTFFLITCMFEDSRGNLWFGTHNGGLYKYRTKDKNFRVYDIRDGLASNWITNIAEDKTGIIWVGSWGGGLTLIGENGVKIIDTSNGLHDLKIRKIIEDREGNVLIGTNENGLSIFKGYHFRSYFPGDGLKDPQVWSILQDKGGNMWFGTSNGLSIFNPEAEKGKQFRDFHKLTDNRILFLKEDQKSRVWIGTDNQGVFTYNRKNSNFSYEQYLNSYINSLLVTALETDSLSRVWVGSLYGLIVYEYETKSAGFYTQTDGLSGNEITALYNDWEGKMWIGSRGQGLDFFVADSIYHLPLEETFTATSICSDSNGKLWVGTEARGVFHIDPVKGKIIKNFRQSDGLLANLINLVITDDEDKVYVGTNQGLNFYDPLNKKIYSYNHKNGFIGIETKPDAVYHDNEGKIWFGTIRGVTSLNPEKLRTTDMDPLTHIISFKVTRAEKGLVPDLTLRHHENDIEFEYISICLTNPDEVAYQIMLEGTDNNWRPVTTQKTVIYPKLAPNHYTFKVKGRNSAGNWNENPISYSFEIKPPFYQTAWFIILCIFLGAAGIIIYIKIRERNLIREKRILEEKVAERTAEVVSQKEELAEKNKDITDSIRYAKRIQFAVLPPEIPFNNTFILFKPKDIVSGDFYWLEESGDKEFIAAVDCTGHGVPGAFMSLIGSNLLNKIVKEQNIHKPGDILDNLNKEVIRSLKSSDEKGAVYDGMDLALICYDRKTSELEYAGAYNPLVLIRNGELQEIKADRFSIGRSSVIRKSKRFTSHLINIEKGDSIYIFSDGYADQFGGDSGKKFKSKPMKELFLAIKDKSSEDQKNILDTTIETWRGDIEQVDDILVIGRKFI